MRVAIHTFHDTARRLLYRDVGSRWVSRLAYAAPGEIAWLPQIAEHTIEWHPSRESAQSHLLELNAERQPLYVRQEPMPGVRHVPIPWCMEDVQLRGEKLHPVLWQGRQWAVTTYGIEARDGTYYLQPSQLRSEPSGYTATAHMTEKSWVDIADFHIAHAVALHLLLGDRFRLPRVPQVRETRDFDPRWESMILRMPTRNRG